MFEPLIPLLVALAAATPGTPPAPVTAIDPVEACRQWMEARPWDLQEEDPQARVLSANVACFDGVVSRASLQALHAWIDAAAEAVPPVLVVRSRGGDSESALELAEKLQAHGARVHVAGVCASACANYFYAGVRDRHVQESSLLLFHGGFSAENTADALEALEAHLRGPHGASVQDPDANRRAIRQAMQALLARQDALYRRAGVDPRIVHGFDGLDAASLDDASCGGASPAPRHFLFFDDAQMRRLGIAPLSGRTLQEPREVNAAIAALGAGFIACLAPDPHFAGTPAAEAGPAR
jgi:hypothetical protein